MPYAWAFLLLVPLAAIAWRRREWAVLALLVGLQAYGIRAQILGMPTTLLEFGIYVVAIVSVWQGDWRGVRPRTLIERYGWWLAPPLLWLGAAVIGTIVAPDVRTAAGILKGWMFDPLVLGLMVLRCAERAADGERWWRNVTAALLAGAVLTTLHGFWQTASQELARLQSGWDSPNVLAMYLVPPLVMTLAQFLQPAFRSGERRRIWAWGLGALVVTAGVVRTGSYGAWLALFAALAVAVLWQWKGATVHWRRAVGAGLVLVGLIGPWAVVRYGAWPTGSHRNETYGITSGDVRFVLWSKAVSEIARRPIFGQGLGQWQGEFVCWARSEGLLSIRNPGLAIELTHASLFPHQLWLTTWLSLGLLGVLALAGAVVLVFSIAGSAAAVPAAALTAILVHGMVDTPAFKNDLAVLLWAAFAFAMWLGRDSRKSEVYEE